MPHTDFDAKKRERGAAPRRSIGGTAVLRGIYTDNDIIFHHAPSCKPFLPFSACGMPSVMPPAGYTGPPRLTGAPLPPLCRGRCPHRPADRRTISYISDRQRQRRRMKVNTTFRHRPTDTTLADRKGFQNLGFGGVFCILFAAVGKKYAAGGRTRRFLHQSPSRTPKKARLLSQSRFSMQCKRG